MLSVDVDAGIITLAEGEKASAEISFSNRKEWFIDIEGTYLGSIAAKKISDISVRVEETGRVVLDGAGIRLNRFDSFVNYGLITELEDEDFVFAPALKIIRGSAVNHGTVIGLPAGLEVGDGASDIYNTGSLIGDIVGISLGGDRSRVLNTGLVRGDNEDGQASGIGTFVDNADIWNAGDGIITGEFISVQIGRVVNTDLRNDGTILQTGVGNQAGNTAVRTNGRANDILNTGLIRSDDVAVEVFGNRSKILNSGTIQTLNVPGGEYDNVALLLQGDGHVVENTGVIDGDILMLDGNNRFLGSDGVVTGQILLGDGRDFAIAGDTADKIRGERGSDIIDAGGGADIIRGGTGDDRIDGGNGKDNITGGNGNDVLAGGLGADVFVFGLRSDNDVILDFEGWDRLDLTVLGVDEAAVRGAAREVDAGLVIDLDALGGEGRLLLAGLEARDLSDGFLL